MEFELGQKIRAPGRLIRTHFGDNKIEWQRLSNREVVGIYIGWRTYANGIVRYGHEGTCFTATEHIKIALIVTDPRRSPVPVLYELMERTHGDIDD